MLTLYSFLFIFDCFFSFVCLLVFAFLFALHIFYWLDQSELYLLLHSVIVYIEIYVLNKQMLYFL